jgi:hypothetical protein
MEGKERSLTHIFKKIESLVVLIFQRKIPFRISRLDYLLRPHTFTNNIHPLVYLISGFMSGPVVSTEDTKSYFHGNPDYQVFMLAVLPAMVFLPERHSLVRLYERGGD